MGQDDGDVPLANCAERDPLVEHEALAAPAALARRHAFQILNTAAIARAVVVRFPFMRISFELAKAFQG